jgi:prepilin-type N-terminal cleavage/methylation domain-containing protein
MKPTQAGFTLVELVVTMVMLSLVLLGVAQLTFILARGAATVAGGAARGGILAQQVNQFAAIPVDSLKGKAGTVTVNKPPLPYTRTTTVDSLSPKLRRVTIIITPLNPVFKPDTLVVQRTKPSANPFRTGP